MSNDNERFVFNSQRKTVSTMDPLAVAIVFVRIALTFLLLVTLIISCVMVYRRKDRIRESFWSIFYFKARPTNVLIGFIITFISIFTSPSPSTISNADIAINGMLLFFSYLFSYCQYLTQCRYSTNYPDDYHNRWNKHIFYPAFALVDILVYIILVTFNKDNECVYRLYSIMALTVYSIMIYLDWTLMFYYWQNRDTFSTPVGVIPKTKQKKKELYCMDLPCICLMIIMMSLLVMIQLYPKIDETNHEIFGKFMKTIGNSLCPLISSVNLLYRIGVEENQKPFEIVKEAKFKCDDKLCDSTKWRDYQRNRDRNDNDPSSYEVTNN